VLDWRSDSFTGLAGFLGTDTESTYAESVATESYEQAWLRHAHQAIAAQVRPVYALNDIQPSSKTLDRGRGSCSQRLAVLEALARRRGIRTRVEGLVVDGRFWYPRFPRTPWLVPDRVVLAWPEFRTATGGWIPVGELFEATVVMEDGFTNAGEETLFDAIGRTGVTWRGDCSTGVCDLSGHLLETLGYFDHRDDLFKEYGQTLCWAARTIGDPFMSHRSAGARTK
jgi:hypothetical protein